MIRTGVHFTLTLGLALTLAACGGPADGGNVDALDGDLASANGTDPALRSALQDQIMVDPTLASQANGDAIRPPGQPYSAQAPATTVAAHGAVNAGELMRAPPPVEGGKCEQCAAAQQSMTLGALASKQKDGRTAGCASSLQYSAAWADRLPPDLPLYPQARVVEAAGSQGGTCALRVVSFTASASMQNIVDFYYTKATRGGYSAEHRKDGEQHMIGGTRDRDDGAYVVFMTPRTDGTIEVDLVANNGV